MTRRRLTVTTLAVVVPAILIGSFLPVAAKVWLGTTVQYVAIPLPGTALHINVHRMLHVAAFGITAWLLMSLAQTWRARVFAAFAVCALAVTTEAGESEIYRIRMEWEDVRDDAAGVAAALLLTRRPRVRTETSNPAASGR